MSNLRIAIVSDTHRQIDVLLENLQREYIDELFFLGDCYNDGLEIARRLNISAQLVRGNVEPFDCIGPTDLIVKRDKWTIFLTHGHRYNVKMGLSSLSYRSEELNADLTLFGHTHTPFYEKLANIILFNPGSASYPNYNNECSWGLLELNEKHVKLTHHYF